NSNYNRSILQQEIFDKFGGEKMKSKYLTAFIAVLFVLVLSACGGGEESSSSDADASSGDGGGEISAKIGVVSFITGSGAAYGEAITSGLELAQEEINAQGDVHIELLIEDSAGEADQALSAAQKLMNSEDIIGLIGPTLSTEFEVVAPVADQNGLPILGTSVTA